MKKTKSKGFTLIELMVVISIIALLSSIVLASLKSAREKANETRILGSIKSFQIALELYKNEKGYYPTAGFSSYKQGNTTVINKGGDFSNFSKYMNLDSAFDPKKLPDNFSISYIINDPQPFENWYGDANMILACGNGTEDAISVYNKLSGLNRYIVNISYKTNSSVFSKLPSTFAFFENTEDYEYADISGIGYVNDKGVCISSEN